MTSLLHVLLAKASQCLQLSLLLAASLLVLPAAEAQSFIVVHSFSGFGDGAYPYSGVTIDHGDNLYVTTQYGGRVQQYGAVDRLSNRGGGWTVTPLYQFAGGSDGSFPQTRVVFGPGGRLYGTTSQGGENNSGTVYSLAPPPFVCRSSACLWTKTTLYNLGQNLALPNLGDLAFDAAGNIYGVTTWGGTGSCEEHGCGGVYQLSKTNGVWQEMVLHNFSGDEGGSATGVVLDSNGNVYGTTTVGGPLNHGTIYQLAYGSWVHSVLYDFPNLTDGAHPTGLIRDNTGNFFGSTLGDPPGALPTLFELAPAGDSWTFQVLYTFGPYGGPWTNLSLDASGNLYGTTFDGGANGFGSVFKLTYSNGDWSYTSLHDFTGGSDGANPLSGVSFDSHGNLYGTTVGGGQSGYGVVWEITP